MTLPAPRSPCTLNAMPSLLALTCIVSPNSFKSRHIF
eukprot:CAMPEP_0176046592 /NCGR_PEP_ID=MMETSP0120_2-20121206/23135_1 /TAXON_ID=160619 /ORGANISM="Kryptoperidinium foliaceum, Strain CCMP 1326" /LENGTH=36 /DNA_ID= /DNA_START= /DNA_END= /DNA_ORIENTATION=